MDKLIAELEAASEGSRELDARITALVKGLTFTGWLGHYYTADEIAGGLGGSERDVPLYTTSLDAALTLVPEGWSLAQLYDAVDPKDRPWVGVELRRDDPDYKLMKTLGAKSYALALCIAALKARQAMEAA